MYCEYVMCTFCSNKLELNLQFDISLNSHEVWSETKCNEMKLDWNKNKLMDRIDDDQTHNSKRELFFNLNQTVIVGVKEVIKNCIYK